MTTYLLPSRTFTLRQPATASKYHIFQPAIAASADGIALSARSPLTVEGMGLCRGHDDVHRHRGQ